jgi:hypothetical protein
MTVGSDIMRNTLVVGLGANAPALTTATQATTASLDIQTLASRPHTAAIEIPVNISVAAGLTVSYTGLMEQSLDNTNWTTIPGSEISRSWTAPAGGALAVADSLRVGCDMVNSRARYIRSKITPVFAGGSTVTTRGLCAVLSGLDKS